MMTQMLGLIDGEGVYGTFLTYGMTFAFVGGAFIFFVYLWWNGRLDMDEEPKMQMMKADGGEEENHGNT